MKANVDIINACGREIDFGSLVVKLHPFKEGVVVEIKGHGNVEAMAFGYMYWLLYI